MGSYFKVLQQFFYVMGKALSGKLSYNMQTGLISKWDHSHDRKNCLKRQFFPIRSAGLVWILKVKVMRKCKIVKLD